MKDYREIDKKLVWESLIAGKKVIAVVFESQYFTSTAHNIMKWNVDEINKLLSDEEVIYFEKVGVNE